MDVFLSVNNREEVLQLPVVPSSFTISKPQTTEKFETVSGEEILLIGKPKLKSISIESFFPVREYLYLHHTYNPDMWGWDYVYKIDTWIAQKLPIRLIITYESSDTPINMAVAVTNFEYTLKSDGDLWYKIDFEPVSYTHLVLYDEYDNLAEIDSDAQRKWLAERYDISGYSDDEILKARTGSYVFAKASIQFNDAIEDLRFSISME